MSHMAKVAGIALLAASWVGIPGCDHDGGHHRDRVIVVPAERHETTVYTHDRHAERKVPEHHDRN